MNVSEKESCLIVKDQALDGATLCITAPQSIGMRDTNLRNWYYGSYRGGLGGTIKRCK